MAANDMPSRETDVQLTRFSHLKPETVQRCAMISPRIGQLATSFPLAFAALTERTIPLEVRLAAVQLALTGAPLVAIADMLSIPFALRSVPPEGCPDRLYYAPWTSRASKALPPFIPKDPQQAALWLKAITFARLFGDEEIAFWVARHHVLLLPGRMNATHLRPLVMHAWASRHDPELIGPCPRWTSLVQPVTALERCDFWIKYLNAVVDLGPDTRIPPILPNTKVGKLTLHPLDSAFALVEEAIAMGHCVNDYAEMLADGSSRLFSIRSGHARIATMEVRWRDDNGMLKLAQIHGPCNDPVSPVLACQMSEFLRRQSPVPPPQPIAVPPPDVSVARLFASYRSSVHPECRPVIDALKLAHLTASLHTLWAIADAKHE